MAKIQVTVTRSIMIIETSRGRQTDLQPGGGGGGDDVLLVSCVLFIGEHVYHNSKVIPGPTGTTRPPLVV
ncbi:hypothetical protein PV328_007833, partial [Microctonus aethiopoides]